MGVPKDGPTPGLGEFPALLGFDFLPFAPASPLACPAVLTMPSHNQRIKAARTGRIPAIRHNPEKGHEFARPLGHNRIAYNSSFAFIIQS
jgi:hypothetical protein